MENVKKSVIIFSFIFSVFLFAHPSSADIVYFKNGKVHEGQVKQDQHGYWVEGILFKESEIEKVEKSKPKPIPKQVVQPVVEQEPKSWFAKLLGAKEEPTQEVASNVVGHPHLNKGHKNPTGVTIQGPQSGGGYFGNLFGALANAQAMQQQAAIQQMQMEQQIMMMEGYDDGYYQDPGYSSSPSYSQSYNNSSSSQNNKYRGRENRYEQPDRSYGSGNNMTNNSRMFQGIQFDNYGGVSWE